MALERLLRLWISILQRVFRLKSYFQLPRKILLWLPSKLRHIVNQGRRTLPSSETASGRHKEIGIHGSFFCASQLPPPRAELEGHSLSMLHIPGLDGTSILLKQFIT
jgi:hypothetical protein